MAWHSPRPGLAGNERHHGRVLQFHETLPHHRADLRQDGLDGRGGIGDLDLHRQPAHEFHMVDRVDRPMPRVAGDAARHGGTGQTAVPERLQQGVVRRVVVPSGRLVDIDGEALGGTWLQHRYLRARKTPNCTAAKPATTDVNTLTIAHPSAPVVVRRWVSYSNVENVV